MVSAKTVLISIILSIFMVSLIEAKKINPGTNYEVDEEDIVTYTHIGCSCDPAIQNDNTKKNGICASTLYCDPKTRLCDCEDTGPYKYTVINGKCKNYVGSRCYNDYNCVPNAKCIDSVCRCEPKKSCVSRKIPAKPVIKPDIKS